MIAIINNTGEHVTGSVGTADDNAEPKETGKTKTLHRDDGDVLNTDTLPIPMDTHPNIMIGILPITAKTPPNHDDIGGRKEEADRKEDTSECECNVAKKWGTMGKSIPFPIGTENNNDGTLITEWKEKDKCTTITIKEHTTESLNKPNKIKEEKRFGIWKYRKNERKRKRNDSIFCI